MTDREPPDNTISEEQRLLAELCSYVQEQIYLEQVLNTEKKAVPFLNNTNVVLKPSDNLQISPLDISPMDPRANLRSATRAIDLKTQQADAICELMSELAEHVQFQLNLAKETETLILSVTENATKARLRYETMKDTYPGTIGEQQALEDYQKTMNLRLRELTTIVRMSNNAKLKTLINKRVQRFKQV